MFHCRRPGGGRVGGWLRDERDRGFAGAAPPDSRTFRIERPPISSSSSVFDRGPYGLSWLDLAGRWLRLDRLAATAVADFFPLPAAPAFLAHQTSRRLAILRCAPARSRVRRRSLPARRSPSRPRWSRARNRDQRRNHHGEHRLLQEGQCRVRSRTAKCPLCQVTVIEAGQSWRAVILRRHCGARIRDGGQNQPG